MSEFSGRDLTCIRGERVVFSRLGFVLGGGGALLLVGPNGSGKSSLLRLMAGLLWPASGTITWDGGNVGDDAEAHNARLHYVGHLDSVKPVLTVAENLGFWAALRGSGEEAVGAALDTFGIGHLAEVPGRFLSAGQKRRLNLARLAVAPVELWLLDEPTTALDAAAAASLRYAIAGHRAAGGMAVICTHAELGIEDASVLDLGAFSGNREAAS